MVLSLVYIAGVIEQSHSSTNSLYGLPWISTWCTMRHLRSLEYGTVRLGSQDIMHAFTVQIISQLIMCALLKTLHVCGNFPWPHVYTAYLEDFISLLRGFYKTRLVSPCHWWKGIRCMCERLKPGSFSSSSGMKTRQVQGHVWVAYLWTDTCPLTKNVLWLCKSKF